MSIPDPFEAAERFVEKWSASELSERAASREDFIDLRRLIGRPAPFGIDPIPRVRATRVTPDRRIETAKNAQQVGRTTGY
jgi:hypothetical protein